MSGSDNPSSPPSPPRSSSLLDDLRNLRGQTSARTADPLPPPPPPPRFNLNSPRSSLPPTSLPPGSLPAFQPPPGLPRESTESLSRPSIELGEARFQPKEPQTWADIGLDPGVIEPLILKLLLSVGNTTGTKISQELCIAVGLAKELLEQLKFAKYVQHRTSNQVGDFVYELTDAGRARATEFRKANGYVGSVPVPFGQYTQAMDGQGLRTRRISREDLARAFADMSLPEDVQDSLGPAVTAARAIFLYGDAGNGKTSIAERVIRCYGDTIWIPQALWIDGHIVKLYDPAVHEAMDPAGRPQTSSERIDRRWIKIRRPTVLAGGELTLDMLEFQVDEDSHVCEAPLQLKANGGALIIDDFGRQRIEPHVLLNRWIYPLERRTDFLRLPDGRKIAVPFEPVLIFSTNLEPASLVDEAFLRRIPYKVSVPSPTVEQFRELIALKAKEMGVEVPPGSIKYLVDRHFLQLRRAMRFCHPRDLLLQVLHRARWENKPPVASPESWDRAVAAYFG